MEKNGIADVSRPASSNDHFLARVRAEFKHIRFPDAHTTIKTTGFVMVTAFISGAVIALYDAAFTYAISFLL